MASTETIDIVPKPAVEALYRDFCEDFSKLADLYFADPKQLDAYVEMTSDPYLRLVKREPLFEALHGYNEELGAPEPAMENIRRLKRDGSYVVLAWQHPYLLGGPFETYLKVLTAVLLCRKLNETGAGHFVPVLWAETDFHDLTEVNRVHIPRGADLVTERLEVDEADRPAVDVETGAAYDALLGRLGGALGVGAHGAWLQEAMAASQGANLGDHFARFMVRIFGEHGLVVASPHRLRDRTADLIARALQQPEQVVQLLEDGREKLEQKGYPRHIDWDDPLHLYYLEQGTRVRLRYQEGAFAVGESGRTMTPAEVANQVKAHPERFSTGVFLSPIAQDYCLPCVAHIAGPGGVAFFGVQKGLFDTLYVAFPIVTPQISATFVDPRAAAGLKTMGESLQSLLSGGEEAAGDDAPDDGAILRGLAAKAQAALQDYAARAQTELEAMAASAEAARSAVGDAAAGVTWEASLRGADQPVRTALDRFHDKLQAVSKETAQKLAPVRKLAQDAAATKLARPEIHAAKEALLRAAEELARLAQVATKSAPTALGAQVGAKLAELGREALLAAVKASGQVAASAEAVRTLLAPNGGLQEDTIATIYFLHRYGKPLTDQGLELLDPFEFRHQVVLLDA